MEVADVVLEAFSRFHLNGKEVIVIPPEFSPGSVLVVERLLYLFEVPKRLAWKLIEPIVGRAFKTGWEHMAQERVFIGIECHLILLLAAILDGSVTPE